MILFYKITLNLKIFDFGNFEGILLYLRSFRNFFGTESILFSSSKSIKRFAKLGFRIILSSISSISLSKNLQIFINFSLILKKSFNLNDTVNYPQHFCNLEFRL